MTRLLLCLPLLTMMGCPPPCVAQITLTEQKVQVVSGLENPQVLGDAVIIGEASKPVVATASLITIELKQPYDTVIMEAEQIPSLEIGNLRQLDASRWLLQGTGRYRIAATAFGPKFARERLMVELGPPLPPPPPPGPKPDELSQVSKDSRAAMQVFVQSMASNFDQLASETRLGKYKTVLDASNAANSFDLVSRNAFKAAMAKVMQPKLGNADLPADAAQTFEEIGIGFKGVR